jgi:hypothetical protein
MGIHTNVNNEKYMVFEFVDGGSLVDYLPANKKKLDLEKLLDMYVMRKK